MSFSHRARRKMAMLKYASPCRSNPLVPHGLTQYQPGPPPCEVFILAGLPELAVESWRGDFERVARGEQILNVQDRAHLLADQFAVAVRHAAGLVNINPEQLIRPATLQLDVHEEEPF